MVKKFGGSGGATAESYLKKLNNQKWINSHKTNKIVADDEVTSRKNIEFAKDLFLSWDTDNDGQINENDIIRPLVSLGLAPDSKFARKICQALDPKHSLRKQNEALEVNLDDFIKIFKNDKISDMLMQIISRETEKRHLKYQKAVAVSDLPF